LAASGELARGAVGVDGDTQAAWGFCGGAELDGQSPCYEDPPGPVRLRHRAIGLAARACVKKA